MNDDLDIIGQRNRSVHIHYHSIVNNEGNLDTIVYKTFEDSNQEELYNIEKNMSIAPDEHCISQSVVNEDQIIRNIVDNISLEEGITSVIEGIIY